MKTFLYRYMIAALLSVIATAAYSQPPENLPENARVEIEGTLQVFIREHLQNHTADYEYFLDRGEGNPPVKLVFADQHPSSMRSGVGIAVRGLVRNGNVEVTAANIEQGTAADSTSGSAQATVLDARSAVVVVVNLSDQAHRTDDLANMQSFYFGASNSMSDMYEQISFGQLMVSGDVFGPINSSRSTVEVCDNPFTFASEFLSQAESQFGFNRANYQHRIFAIPRDAGCGWTGYANVGCGSSCSAFNRWSQDTNTTSHEMGHNLYMAHAGVGTNQYADYSSFMGYSINGRVRALDGAHHWQMGWHSDYDAASIETITTSGTYSVTPLQETFPATHTASIYRIDVGNGDPYFISARRAEGYDTDLATLNSAALTGVNIHRYVGSGYGPTLRVAQLDNGGRYIDDLNGLTITQLSRDTDGTVGFTVDLGEGECIEASPTLSLSPEFTTVGPGSSYNFSVNLTNQDSTACGSSSFRLSSETGTLNPTSLSVAPGAQSSATLSVTGGSTSGDINFTVSVVNEAVSANGTLTVDADAPEDVTNLSGTYQKKGKNHRAQLSWTNSSSPDTNMYLIYRDGQQVGTTSQNSYTDNLPTPVASSYAYQVKAVDAFGNTSSGTTTSVTTAGSDGGGGGGDTKPCRGNKCSN